MRRKQLLTGGIAFIGIIMFVLEGKTALAGAQAGIDLCIRCVIPSLFPILFLSILLSGSLYGSRVPFFHSLGKLLHMPKGSEIILITGFLGGYPAGAQAIASVYESNQLDKKTAERLLSFCNNAGPAFLFGMVSPLFLNLFDSVSLWMIHILSALYTALLIPSCSTDNIISVSKQAHTIDSAMGKAIRVMSTICGWIILFRGILEFLNRWFFWMFPLTVRVILCSFLELSNGICMMQEITDPGLRYVICSIMLAWGGVCVTLQTLSVIGSLSIKAYLKGKFLQTVISLILSISVCMKIWFPVIILLLLPVILLRKMKNSCSNPVIVGV